jgi:hypothetical protein
MKKQIFQKLKCLTVLAGLLASVGVWGQPQQKPSVSDSSKTKVVTPVMTANDSLLCEKQLKIILTSIKNAQLKHVRLSYGENDGECFTWKNYEKFQLNEVAKIAASEIVTRKEIKEGILQLRKLNVAIKKVTSDLRNPLHDTWSERGRIDPSGQTYAGQQAELDIANAVVDRVIQRFEDTSWQPGSAAK